MMTIDSLAINFLVFISVCFSLPCVSQTHTTDNQEVTFLVKEGQTVTVRGNLKTGVNAAIIVRGTLQVEGDMIIHHHLNLIIEGEGKLIVGGNLESQSLLKKEIAVSDSGRFTVQNIFHAGSNMQITVHDQGLIRAKGIIADRSLTVKGTRNFLVSDCRCKTAHDAACDFCQSLVADSL